jgi:hypothetical protein
MGNYKPPIRVRSNEAEWPHFGQQVRDLRRLHMRQPYDQRYAERAIPAEDHEERSIAMVCIGLEAYGYPLSIEQYRAIESGRRLPSQPHQFIVAFCETLDLDDDECEALTMSLWYDDTCRCFTPSVARDLFLSLMDDAPSSEAPAHDLFLTFMEDEPPESC